MDNRLYIDAWEKRVSETTAHLKVDKDYLPEKPLKGFYKKAVGDFSLDGKSIIDIGCGGALFGEWALNRYSCEYAGMDIAERSCNAAIERLREMGRIGTIYHMPNPKDGLELLRKPGFDVAVCLNVIQHIPDCEYFEFFLSHLNISGIKNIILQYKHDEITLFQEAPYKTTHEINLACYTNKKDIMYNLDNYKIYSNKKSGENRFLVLELKEK